MSKNRVREIHIDVAEDGTFVITVQNRVEDCKNKTDYESLKTLYTRQTLDGLYKLLGEKLIKGTKK